MRAAAPTFAACCSCACATRDAEAAARSSENAHESDRLVISFRRCKHGARSRDSLRGCTGNREDELRAFFVLGVDPDASAVRLDDVARDRQAEARARVARFGAPETLEDVRGLAVREAGPRVEHP